MAVVRIFEGVGVVGLWQAEMDVGVFAMVFFKLVGGVWRWWVGFGVV